MMLYKAIHVLIVALAAHVITAEVMCPSHPNCICGGTLAIELNCNIDGRTIKIDFLPNTYINIKCENATSLDYSKLPKCFNEMTAFKSVSFKDCPLPKTSFKQILDKIGISKTMSLIFQNSKPLLGYFNRNHFAGLHDLTKLLLSVNGITYLPDNLFMDINNITWLNIRCNNINLSEELLKPLEKLETLEISHNHMTNISSNLFSHLSLLRKLSLWQSNVTWFSNDFFTGVDVLEELDLSSNGLDELPTSIFKPLKKLKKLTLFSNKFSALPQDLFSNNNILETVVILNNDAKMKSLPRALFANLPSLRQVYIQRSGIEVVPHDVFANSTYITNISLAYNDIEHIPETTFIDQIYLLELDLSHNELTILENKLFIALEELKHLDLSYNSIEELSRDTFTPLTNLIYLNMEHNNLKRVSAFLFAINLKRMSVSLAYNHLDFENLMLHDGTWSIAKHSPFVKTMEMEMLNLSHNKFKYTFEDWFTNGHDIVDISHNSIQDLWHETGRTVHLPQMFKLSYVSVVDQAFKHLYISNNPLRCTCENFHFISYLRKMLQWTVIDEQSFQKCPFINHIFCPDVVASSVIVLMLCLLLMFVTVYRYSSITKKKNSLLKHGKELVADCNTNKNVRNILLLYCDEDEVYVRHTILPELKTNKRFIIDIRSIKDNDISPKNLVNELNEDVFVFIVFSPNYLMKVYRDVNIKKIRDEMLEMKNTVYLYFDVGPPNSVYDFLQNERDVNTTVLWGPNFWSDLYPTLPKKFKKGLRLGNKSKRLMPSKFNSLASTKIKHISEKPQTSVEMPMNNQD